MPEPLTTAQTSGEFSVWWQDPAGTNHCELSGCGAEEAVEMAVSLTRRPAARLGIIVDVKIIDGGDDTCWHWHEGVVIYDGGHTLPKPSE